MHFDILVMIHTALYQADAGYTGSDGWSWYTLFLCFAFAFSFVSLFASCGILNISRRATIYPLGGTCTCMFFLDSILVVEIHTHIDIYYFRWRWIWIALVTLRYVYDLG